MDLYRKSNVFERLLSLYSSPHIPSKTRTKILQLVYRAVQVGGSMTLITRVGILSWLDVQLAIATDVGVLEALKKALEEESRREEVQEWKFRSGHSKSVD